MVSSSSSSSSFYLSYSPSALFEAGLLLTSTHLPVATVHRKLEKQCFTGNFFMLLSLCFLFFLNFCSYHLNKQYIHFLMIKSRLSLGKKKKGKCLSKCRSQRPFNLLRCWILFGFRCWILFGYFH